MATLIGLTAPFARAAGDDSTRPASAWVKQGLESFNRQEYEDARASFARAYEIDSVSWVLLDLAIAELQSGHPIDALRHLRAYVKAPDAVPEKIEVVHARWLPRAEAQTARLTIAAPPGALIVVDGVDQGRAPVADAVDVSAGDHVVIATSAGQSSSIRVRAAAGDALPVRLEFPVLTPSPPASDISPQSTNVRATSAWPSAKTMTVIFLGSAALAIVVIGAGFDLAAANNGNQAQTLSNGLGRSACTASPPPAECVPLQEALNTQGQDTNVAIGFFGAGAVLAAAAVGTALWWPSQAAPRRAWQVRPSIDPIARRAVLDGRF